MDNYENMRLAFSDIAHELFPFEDEWKINQKEFKIRLLVFVKF